MAIVQVTIRDEPEHVREFLLSCGATIGADIPSELASTRMRLSQPFTFSFHGTVPLPSKSQPQTVVDALSPEAQKQKQREVWGCAETSLATLLKVQWVVPTFTSHDSSAWKLFNYPLLEVSFRMICDGVPDRWLQRAYHNIQWAQMLWCRSREDVTPVIPNQEYGGVFTDKENEFLYNIPWRVLSATGAGFLAGNGWVTKITDQKHVAPIRTPVPAIRCVI